MGFAVSKKSLDTATVIFFGLLVIIPPSLLGISYWRSLQRDAVVQPFEEAPPFPSNIPEIKDVFTKYDARKVQDNEWVVHVDEVPSIEYGIREYYMKRRRPFIVRRAQELMAITPARLINGLLRNRSMIMKGYVNSDQDVFFPAHEMLARWHAGQDVLVIDAPVPQLVHIPDILSQYNSFSEQTHSEGQEAATETSVQLSAKHHHTCFHNDPPETGGGWVYVANGEKHWIYMSPEYLDDVGRFFPELENATFEQLQAFVELKGSGPFYVATIQDGDFICWPPAWPHKVYTAQRFIGLGSYMITPVDAPYLERYRHGMKAARGEEEPSYEEPTMVQAARRALTV